MERVHALAITGVLAIRLGRPWKRRHCGGPGARDGHQNSEVPVAGFVSLGLRFMRACDRELEFSFAIGRTKQARWHLCVVTGRRRRRWLARGRAI